MKALPLKLGTLHFIGIGGIGMSGIAEVLHNMGYSVQGSDISENANVLRLRARGIRVIVGHGGENIYDEDGAPVAAVVRSTAVKQDNPEVAAAQKINVPVIRRAEMLAELMRLVPSIAVGGTHGKTTTTSLIGHVLEGAELDPTIINGGIINTYGSNTRMGEGDWMVVEADESDGTFTMLPAIVGVITNIDPEHMDHYGSFDAVKDAFRKFVNNLPFYGFVAACIDHEEVEAMLPEFSRRVVTYGFSDKADIRAENLKTTETGVTFDVVLDGPKKPDAEYIRNISVPMFGKHNVLNVLAAITVAVEIGIGHDVIARSLASFGGVKRRFTKTGESNGVTVIDDYGHHPVEIEAVLKAGRESLNGSGGRIIAVAQPHRYSRLSDLLDEFSACFAEADTVVIADVYAAGEEPIEGADRDGLVKGIMASGHKDVQPLDSAEDLPVLVANIARPGDLVICLGAGNITQWANALPGALDEIYASKDKTANGIT